MRLLLLGGHGTFGARIARALAGEPGIELVLAGRDAACAGRLGRALGVGWQRADAADPGLANVPHAGGFELVIHTAGPFQGQDWRVAAAAAEAGAHYIDLADGRRFVCDFERALDARFRAAGRVAITGASTLPAPSTAVIADLRPRFCAIDTIDLCIAPGTGGMVVRLGGRSPAGRPLALAWHVTAPGNHGPEIACMAAIALARRLAAGERMAPGARACVELVRLDEFEPQFARFGMTVDVLEEEGA